MFHIEQSNPFEGLSSSLEGFNMVYNPPSPSVPPSTKFKCEEETTIATETSNGKSPPVKAKMKRKRARATKTSEEVEKQRMTHIAVERNRRKQMNEHLQILRSLMPPSYAQRGDQASIVGGAIELVRELEQLLQCLESVKAKHETTKVDDQGQPLLLSMALEDINLIMDQTAESKSCLASVEVNLSGFFGLIKILSRRRPGQLIKNVAAVEHLHLRILQSNITTIQEDVTCCFSVMMNEEAMLTAEEIANSIQHALLSSSLHANSSMS